MNSNVGEFLKWNFSEDLRHWRKVTMWGLGRDRVGGRVGVSGMTIKRIELGQEPAVAVFLGLCALMAVNPMKYYAQATETQQRLEGV